MLSKPQLIFLKRFISLPATQTLLINPAFRLQKTFPPLPLRLLNLSSHPFSSFKYPNNTTNYKDDLVFLPNFSKSQLDYAGELLDRYSTQDLAKFNPKEIESIAKLLQYFAIAFKAQGNLQKAYSYINEAEQVAQKVNIGDTMFLAQNHQLKISISFEVNDKTTDIEYYCDEIDRIVKLFSNDPEARNLKVQNLLLRGRFYKRENEKDKALELFDEVLKKIHYVTIESLPDLLITTYEEMGFIYQERNEFEKALEAWTNGVEIAISHEGKDSFIVLSFYCGIAKLLYQQEKPQEALPYIKTGLEIALKIRPPDHSDVSWCYSWLGNILKANGNLAEALEAYQKSIKIQEKKPQKDFLNLSSGYFQASDLHHQLENHEEAFLLCKKSLDALLRSKDSGVIKTYSSHIYELTESQRFKEFELYFNEVHKVCKNSKLQDKEDLADINFLLGEFAFLEKKDYESAFKLLKESERLYQQTNPDLFYLLDSYLAGINALSKNYDECIRYLQRVSEACQADEDFGYLEQVYYCLAKAYHQKGMVKEAKEAEEKFKKLYEEYNQEDSDIKDRVEHAKKVFSVMETLSN